MRYWRFLFDSDYDQRRDIEALLAQTNLAPSEHRDIVRNVSKLTKRVDKLELLCAALIELLKTRQGLDDAELRQMIVRLDLADGFEDGSLQPARSEKATPCGNCGEPINPQRKACVYCDAPIVTAVEARKKRPIRMVNCSICQMEIQERNTYFSGNGLVCPTCFNDPSAAKATRAGTLALADAEGQAGRVSMSQSGGELSSPDDG